MADCVTLLDPVTASLVDNTPTIALPDICSFDYGFECPEVVLFLPVWIINGASIRVQQASMTVRTYQWSRWRTNNELATNPGAWTAWLPSGEGLAFAHDMVVMTSAIPYDWYDVQFLIEPEGFFGWQEQHPLCGTVAWHLQTPKKFNPPPLDPDIIPAGA